MRENPTVNLDPVIKQKHGPDHVVKEEIRFIRKGQVGDWKNYMNEDISRRFDKWSEEKLNGTGLTFDTK